MFVTRRESCRQGCRRRKCQRQSVDQLNASQVRRSENFRRADCRRRCQCGLRSQSENNFSAEKIFVDGTHNRQRNFRAEISARVVDCVPAADGLYRDAFDVAAARAADCRRIVRRSTKRRDVRICAVSAGVADYVPEPKILRQRLQNVVRGRAEHGQSCRSRLNVGGDFRSVRAVQNRSRSRHGQFRARRRIQPQPLLRVGGHDCHADNRRQILRGACQRSHKSSRRETCQPCAEDSDGFARRSRNHGCGRRFGCRRRNCR